MKELSSQECEAGLQERNQINLEAVNAHLAAQQPEEAWKLLPSVVRLELLGKSPFGQQWSPRLPGVLERLTEEGSISIISHIVTKDSDGPTP